MKERPFLNGWWALLGHKHGADPGSNQRRYYNRFSILLALWLLVAPLISDLTGVPLFAGPYVALLLLAWSLWFFGLSVFLMPFRNAFVVNPARLLFDAITSTFLMIGSFAAVYRAGDISNATTAFDYYYFSAVTFSTLGYGDHAPMGALKPLAAFEAILGNLHLGFVVGAVFAVLNRGSSQ